MYIMPVIKAPTIDITNTVNSTSIPICITVFILLYNVFIVDTDCIV